ncbi:MAG: hypothetical protein JO140_02700 [Candidatus Eremiobacteraeota bacterium]|nr:hypothetical protein [Candidatus Eremiobacteraeota bacterium]
MRSSTFAPVLLAATLVAAPAGCAKTQTQEAPPPPGAARIGYVRMEELLKVHPLYPQLAQTERSIDALSLRSLSPEVAQTGANLSKEDAQLQKELNEASARTKQLLDQKQAEYQKQENAAIAAALAAGGRAAPGQAVGAGVSSTAGRQAGAVAADMNRDLQAYQKTLAAQDRAQSEAYARSVSQRVDRQYRAKANELQSKEQEFGLELATKDAAQRLQLRTQLANLALDDAAREDVRKKIAALDRAEADQVAAMRNRDQATLAALRTQLQEQARTEIASGVAKIHAENQAKMLSRAGGAQVGSAVAVPGSVVAGRSVPPDLKAKIDALHKEYQDRFNRDAKSTIEQFNKTRDELKKRYDELHGIDTVAQAGTRKELAALQAQHDKLYAQIIDQINREVRVVAQNKGVTTVLSEIAGPGEGIDLTGAAKKEIESLHE